MKRAGILCSLFLGVSVLRADFDPAVWHSEPLGTAANNNNEWYLFPEADQSPRILVKSTTSNNNPQRKLLTGGPPVWTEGTSASLGQINKQGVFVPTASGGGYLIAPHNAANLKVVIFGSGGTAALETIDPNAGTYTAISAGLDTGGVLHVAYVWNASTICYARRSGGTWSFTSVGLPATAILDTAVVPITTANGGVNLYYTATAGGVTSLWLSKPGVVNNQLHIQWGANPRVEAERFVAGPLRGSRVGTASRVYFFGGTHTNSLDLKRHLGAGDAIKVETAGAVNPKRIRVAFGPDGLERVAWLNGANGMVHYLKPLSAGVDLPKEVGRPLQMGSGANADLLGFHFDADGLPYLLYRNNLSEGFIAFPNDDFDLNGNGRPDLLDTAFGSTDAGLEALPVGPAAAGVPNSADRFKFRFPTIGSAFSNGQGGVASASRNLTYRVEVSPDCLTWTPVTEFSAISFTQTPPGDDLRPFVAVLPETVPGSLSKRFARMTVARTLYPY